MFTFLVGQPAEPFLKSAIIILLIKVIPVSPEPLELDELNLFWQYPRNITVLDLGEVFKCLVNFRAKF